jgi:tripartite-type tricarboxylate transporter receptor subunit TctC
MGEKLGQSVIVDNRAGGDTIVGTKIVKEAPADGYTILAQANGFSLMPQLRVEPGYDPVKDFTGIGFMTRSPMILVAGMDQPYRNISELVSNAKKDKYSFASAGTGSPPHIACAMFNQAANIDVLHAPYKGNGAALPDVIAGRVNYICDGFISSNQFIKGGKLRALAVTSPARIGPLPDVPTFIEQGVNYSYVLWLGLLVKQGTPKDVVQKLSDALKFALSNKELADRFRSEGSDAEFVSPEVFNDYVGKEVTQMAKTAVDLKLPKE